MSLAQWPHERREQLLNSLSGEELNELQKAWWFWARTEQLPPPGDWRVWLFLGGRGAGKTRAGAEWTRSLLEGNTPLAAGRYRRLALLGSTLGDVREVMVEGPSGLMAIAGEGQRPALEIGRRRLVWPNGAVAQLFSAEDPDSLRGPQFDAAWCDEFAAWPHRQRAFDMLQLGVRLGSDPRLMVTTTPRPLARLKALMARTDTVVTRARTRDNVAFLAPGFVDPMEALYAGTHLARQELDGAIIEDLEGALWTRALIARAQRRVVIGADDLVVVALDPAVTAARHSDRCGLVAAARTGDASRPDYVVLAERSLQGQGPQIWAERAARLAEDCRADRVIAEANQGGELIREVLKAAGVIEVALDDLVAELPLCRSVLLVVSWFGTDLRAGHCQIRPGVDQPVKDTHPLQWEVNGIDRETAYLVSRIDGNPAYGGTPSDQSLIEAMAAIRARGLKVSFYPFILMDIGPGNGLPDPYGGAEQAAYPWRGRITCDIAPGGAGSADQTSAIADDVETFLGQCAAADFTIADGRASYHGPDEFGLRRMILHYAHLCALAGGVDSFMIGSELRGLTQLRSSRDDYPFVDGLQALAADVRAVLGPDTAISYAADWSEYFGHQPQDGTGDVTFHLDPLWSDPAISFVAIDWYAPLSDWRDTPGHADEALGTSGYDRDYLQSQVERGEGYDWYYASQADREAQIRSLITDGAAGKPWVFRYKDIRNWWAEPHYNRRDGVELTTPTGWVPRSKPIRFTEIGFPAVDNGAHQPNVFLDPKSAESALPHLSTGARDDMIQRRALEAVLSYWQPGAPAHATGPDGTPLLDWDNSHVWTWDARPFPAFPRRTDIWRDGENWDRGHWLNGRAGQSDLAAILRDLARRAGWDAVEVRDVDIPVVGFVVDRPLSARAAMEALMVVYGLRADPVGEQLIIRPENADATGVLDAIVQPPGQPAMVVEQGDRLDTPDAVELNFLDATRDSEAASIRRGRVDHRGGTLRLGVSLALNPEEAARRLDAIWSREHQRRVAVQVQLPPSMARVTRGDAVTLPDERGVWRVDTIDAGHVRSARLLPTAAPSGTDRAGVPRIGRSAPAVRDSRPFIAVLDLPVIDDGQRKGPLIGAYAAPWPGSVSVQRMAGGPAVKIDKPMTHGRLIAPLYTGTRHVWDRASRLQLVPVSGTMVSVTPDAALAGAARYAVQHAQGWEIISAATATVNPDGTVTLSDMIRGEFGTAIDAQVEAGALVVRLDEALVPFPLRDEERDTPVPWFALTQRARARRDGSLIWRGQEHRPLAPVQLRLTRSGDGLMLSWMRQARGEVSAWAPAEIRLDEVREQYRVSVQAENGDRVEQIVLQPHWEMNTAFLAEHFPSGLPSTLDVMVAQYSEMVGYGTNAHAALQISAARP